MPSAVKPLEALIESKNKITLVNSYDIRTSASICGSGVGRGTAAVIVATSNTEKIKTGIFLNPISCKSFLVACGVSSFPIPAKVLL